jgi:hypothetical protein
MQPWPEACNENQWVLCEKGRQYLIYCASGSPVRLHDSEEKSSLNLRTVDAKTGVVTEKDTRVSWAQLAELPPERSPKIYWLVHETDK